MEIKIEKAKLLKSAPFLAVTAVLASFFVWQLRANMSLTRELDAKKKEFTRAEAASRHLRNIEKQIDDIKQKQQMLYKKVPVNEKEPFSLIKTLIRLGGQAGLKNITLRLKEKSAEEGTAANQGGGAAQDQGDEGGSEEAASPETTESQGAQGEESSVSPDQSGPSPVYLEMTFEGSFPLILSFLQKLMSLERIVKIEGMSIQRRKDILPYQKVSLDLVTYTF